MSDYKPRPGRKRLVRCSVGHMLTDSARRWKVYERADGSSCLLSNGCRLCQSDKARTYRDKNREAIKARRAGVAR